MEPVDPGRRGRGWFGARRHPGNPTDAADAGSTTTPPESIDPPPPLEGTEHSMTQSPPGSETALTQGSQEDENPEADAKSAETAGSTSDRAEAPDPASVQATEPEPELEPLGFSLRKYGLFVCPPRPDQPLIEFGDL